MHLIPAVSLFLLRTAPPHNKKCQTRIYTSLNVLCVGSALGRTVLIFVFTLQKKNSPVFEENKVYKLGKSTVQASNAATHALQGF